VGETAVFAGETEDFGFEVSRQHGSSRREEFKFKGDLGKFKNGKVQVQERERGNLGNFANLETGKLIDC
jgi:hypothetical protein